MKQPMTILVTGGNRGIGKAICSKLAQKKHRVLMGCRDLQHGQQVATSLGDNVTAVPLDLADSSGVERHIQHILQQYGVIDGLINNAAILCKGNLMSVAPADVSKSLQVNLMGPLILTQMVVKTMQAEKFGRIVNISSGWGSFAAGMEGPLAYSVSKAALNALTLNSARELPDYIKINSMDPGWVRTRMGGPDAPTSPEEPADTACWLVTLNEDGPSGKFFHNKQPIPW